MFILFYYENVIFEVQSEKSPGAVHTNITS